MKFIDRIPFSILAGITLFLVMGMLYFGIRFKGYRLENHIQWLSGGKGLCFSRFSVAFTNDFFPPNHAGDKDTGLTIEIAMRSLDLKSSFSSDILSVYAGEDRTQLLIAQWRHWLLIMNGADYDGRQGIRKMSVDINGAGKRLQLLTITSDRKGTSVYLNGILAKTNPHLRLFYPYRPDRTRLLLGNSVYGHHQWHGVISALALYDAAMTPEAVKAHETQWAKNGFVGTTSRIAPKIRYRFDKGPTEEVNNLAGNDYPLNVPKCMVILKKQFLRWHEIRGWRVWSIDQDMLINLLGFMPLGWMLCATFRRLGGFAGRHYRLLAVSLAFLFSLSLEITQAWIPSRDSSLIDLIMNTLGAAAGGWINSRQ